MDISGETLKAFRLNETLKANVHGSAQRVAPPDPIHKDFSDAAHHPAHERECPIIACPNVN